MRVLVCGGRDFTDRDMLFNVLDEADRKRRISLVIEGGQRTSRDGELIGGADLWACRWSYARGRPGKRFDADWETHGRSAGPLRNRLMLDEGKPELVIAFPGGKGTANMVHLARSRHLEVWTVDALGLVSTYPRGS